MGGLSTSGGVGEGGGVEGVRLGHSARDEHHAERGARHSSCRRGCEMMRRRGLRARRSDTSEQECISVAAVEPQQEAGDLQRGGFRRGVAVRVGDGETMRA